MSPALAKTCPACQTLNKPKWEFCVRCGESLAGVSATSDGAKASAARAEAAPAARSFSLGMLVWVVVLGAALIGSMVWFVRAPSPKTPERSVFALPGKDSSPSPVRAVKGPGVTVFEEAQKRVAAGDLSGAVPLFVQALSAAPDNVMFRLAYVDCLERLGNVDAAVAELRAGLARPSAELELARRLARILEKAGRVDEAVAACDRALAMQPRDLDSARKAAKLLVSAGRQEGAVPYLRKILEELPSDLTARQQLGEALMAAGETSEAAGLFWNIVQNMPDASVSRVWLAEAQARQGHADAAVDTVRAGLAREADSPVLQRALGAMLEKAGKAKEAAAAYRKYLALAPNAADAKELEARANRLDPAGGRS
jgi:predicted Zn-dependent protease